MAVPDTTQAAAAGGLPSPAGPAPVRGPAAGTRALLGPAAAPGFSAELATLLAAGPRTPEGQAAAAAPGPATMPDPPPVAASTGDAMPPPAGQPLLPLPVAPLQGALPTLAGPSTTAMPATPPAAGARTRIAPAEPVPTADSLPDVPAIPTVAAAAVAIPAGSDAPATPGLSPTIGLGVGATQSADRLQATRPAPERSRPASPGIAGVPDGTATGLVSAAAQQAPSPSPAAPAGVPGAVLPPAPLHPIAAAGPTAAPTAALPDGPARPAPSPAAQVAPVIAPPILVALAAPTQPGGAQSLTIRLDPAELGRVDVRIERTADGPAKVELTVERPDTLLTLMRDQPHLQHALDLAGVPPDGRTLQFSLGTDSGAGTGGLSFSMGTGTGAGGFQRPGGGPGQAAADPASPAHFTSQAAWSGAGLDITA